MNKNEHGYNIVIGKNKIGFEPDLKNGITKGREATMKRFKIISKTNKSATPGFSLVEITKITIDGHEKTLSHGVSYKEKYIPSLKKFIAAKIA